VPRSGHGRLPEPLPAALAGRRQPGVVGSEGTAGRPGGPGRR